MTNEVWKPLNQYSNYEVSSFGNFKNTKTGRILKATIDSNGYRRIQMGRGSRVELAHRLVLKTFSPENEKKCVNHKNGIRSDNRLDNLEWASHRENTLHSQIVLKNQIGEKHGRSRFTEKDVLEIRSRRSAGEKLKSIALDFNTDKAVIHQLASRKSWRHLNG